MVIWDYAEECWEEVVVEDGMGIRSSLEHDDIWALSRRADGEDNSGITRDEEEE